MNIMLIGRGPAFSAVFLPQQEERCSATTTVLLHPGLTTLRSCRFTQDFGLRCESVFVLQASWEVRLDTALLAFWLGVLEPGQMSVQASGKLCLTSTLPEVID